MTTGNSSKRCLRYAAWPSERAEAIHGAARGRLHAHSSRYVIAGLVAAVLLPAAAWAEAAEPQPSQNYVALGIASVPEYIGASDSRTIPLLAGRLSWENRYVEIGGTGVRANLLNTAAFAFGPAVGLAFGRDGVDTQELASLPEVDSAVEMGVFAAYTWQLGKSGRTHLTLDQDALFDVSDTHRGFRSTTSIGLRHRFDSRISLRSRVLATYVDGNFAETYFSIPDDVETPLAPFDADGHAAAVGLSLDASYRFHDRWFATAYLNVRRLIGDAADSPIVQTAGSENQTVVGFGIGRSF